MFIVPVLRASLASGTDGTVAGIHSATGSSATFQWLVDCAGITSGLFRAVRGTAAHPVCGSTGSAVCGYLDAVDRPP